MALYHHDARDYDAAVTEAADLYRAKMQKQIDEGKHRALEVLRLVDENRPQDFIRTGVEVSDQIHVVPQESGPSAILIGKELAKAARVHRHAQEQLSQRARMPSRYLNELLGRSTGWAAELAQRNLRELYSHDNSRYLLRALKPKDAAYEIRGFLSDRFRRLDSGPQFAAFTKAAVAAGLVPVDGIYGDTKACARFLLPEIFEPVKGEVMCFGIEFRNSDYGDGKAALSEFLDKLWCTNMATTQDHLSKIHLGGKLPDDLRLSQKTYDLDTETMASAITDLTADILSPARIKANCEIIRESAAKKLTWKQAKNLLGSKLTKDETSKAELLFEDDNPAAESGATGEGSQLKLSNVISWLANKVADGGRKMELQSFAGELLS